MYPPNLLGAFTGFKQTVVEILNDAGLQFVQADIPKPGEMLIEDAFIEVISGGPDVGFLDFRQPRPQPLRNLEAWRTSRPKVVISGNLTAEHGDRIRFSGKVIGTSPRGA